MVDVVGFPDRRPTDGAPLFLCLHDTYDCAARQTLASDSYSPSGFVVESDFGMFEPIGSQPNLSPRFLSFYHCTLAALPVWIIWSFAMFNQPRCMGRTKSGGLFGFKDWICEGGKFGGVAFLRAKSAVSISDLASSGVKDISTCLTGAFPFLLESYSCFSRADRAAPFMERYLGWRQPHRAVTLRAVCGYLGPARGEAKFEPRGCRDHVVV